MDRVHEIEADLVSHTIRPWELGAPDSLPPAQYNALEKVMPARDMTDASAISTAFGTGPLLKKDITPDHRRKLKQSQGLR